MKFFFPMTVLLAAAIPCGTAFAQLKSPARPGPSTASPAAAAARAAPVEAEATPEVRDKAAAATLAASGWLLLLDRRDWGRAWEATATVFRTTVPLAAWMDGIPKARDLGDFIEREPDEAVYKTTLEGRPNGDYVTIFYSSKFSKKDDVVEIVTTVREPDGKWRVTGYQTR